MLPSTMLLRGLRPQRFVSGILCLSACLSLVAAQGGNFHVPGPGTGNGPAGAIPLSHCALVIPGNGAKGGFPPFDGNRGDICVTYDSINRAFLEARRNKVLPPPPANREWNTQNMSPAGEIVLEVSKIIARQYRLTPDMVMHGLPLIDVSRTLMWDVCPDLLKPIKCEPKRFREMDGLCNNLQNSMYGVAWTPLVRLVPPAYSDGIDSPRVGVDGRPLPSARVVSAHIHSDVGGFDHAVSYMLVGWGQMTDHDMAMAAFTEIDTEGNEPPCCDVEPHERHRNCFQIEVPPRDPFYARFNQKCIDFARSTVGLQNSCKLGARTQMDAVSSILDANYIYSNSPGKAAFLRSFRGGLLRSTPAFRQFGMKDMLPLKIRNPDEICLRPNDNTFCFDAGDIRANEQVMLVCLHTVLMREHNRIAVALSQINPHWDDERLYQETRNIMIAVHQHITYNEFLPMVLGKEVMDKYGLILLKEGYYNGYDATTNPGLFSSFLCAAFRFGHSIVPTTIMRYNKFHQPSGTQRMSQLIRQPFDLYKAGWLDQYILGLVNRPAHAVDASVSHEITNHLFERPGDRFGMDLASLNVQRGRDHGVASYNAFRDFCGVGRARSFDDLIGSMPNETVRRYSEIYRHVDDIDLWSGGLSEFHLPGSMVGPTFACIIGLQFRNLRKGDRFWHENPGWPSSFTPEQLQEVRKVKLSRVICENSDEIDTIQVYVMVLPDNDINPRVPCRSQILPSMDLSKWRENFAG